MIDQSDTWIIEYDLDCLEANYQTSRNAIAMKFAVMSWRPSVSLVSRPY